MIENLPFFKGYHGQDKAVVDIALLEKWINENYEIITEEDEADRKSAYEELESGKSLDLKNVINEW